MRQRMMAVVEQAVRPLLSETQMVLYDKWKKGRETSRSGSLYVLDAKGEPERRYVRLGISDDQFTEIAGGQITAGERVIVRARETAQ